VVAHVPASKALTFTLYPFLFAEIIKIMSASALAPKVRRWL
jgi:biotin transporter BioY